jgi:Zn-dependent protease with chaperone function
MVGLTHMYNRIKTVKDLKNLLRKEILIGNYLKAILVFACALIIAIFKTKALVIVFWIFSCMIIFGFIQKAYIKWVYRRMIQFPLLSETDVTIFGIFNAQDIQKLVREVIKKMKPGLDIETRIVRDKIFQASTTDILYQKRYHCPNTLFIHEGLLHVLSKKELRAIIAHEIGHHMAPKTKLSIIREFWADYYACKYDDPVALVNALIKLDQNSYFLKVFIQRCHHLENYLLNGESKSELWQYLLCHVNIPLNSKRDANREAQRLFVDYLKKGGIKIKKASRMKNLLHRMGKNRYGNILDRKALSQKVFIDWTHYDKRIKNYYLDKYELMELYQVLKFKKMTINRFHFRDFAYGSHPSTNRRIVFIIENFFLSLPTENISGHSLN